jgi:hypothetical protein
MFEAQGELFTEPGYRGCAFVSASAESHPGDLVELAADAYRGCVLTQVMPRVWCAATWAAVRIVE